MEYKPRQIKDNIKTKRGFWIGDLCYTLPKEDYHKYWGNQNNFDDCSCSYEKDKKFIVAGTRWGDGVYKDNYGNIYDVDAGNISIVNYEAIGNQELIEKLKKDYSTSGLFVDGPAKATFQSNGMGIFNILISKDKIKEKLDIEIDTADENAMDFDDDYGW